MTIEEALERINPKRGCFIVWRTDTGEIIKISLTGETHDPVLGMKLVLSMKEDQDTPPTPEETGVEICGRGFKPGGATLEVLTKERDEFLANQIRLKMLREWQQKTAAEILSALELGQLPKPLHSDVDFNILLDSIFELHARNWMFP